MFKAQDAKKHIKEAARKAADREELQQLWTKVANEALESTAKGMPKAKADQYAIQSANFAVRREYAQRFQPARKR